MSSFENPFVLPRESYKRDVNVLGQYVEEVSRYLHLRTGKPLAECTKFVSDNLRPGGRFEFKDPKVDYLFRCENGDRMKGETTLTRYIGESVKNEEIIAPTFTTYVSPRKKESVLVNFVDTNVSRRSKAKKAMFALERTDPIQAKVKEVEQKGRKTSNNSLSGAHLTPSTPLFLKSAHSSLTSTCRSTSGYGNANNEKFLSGNRHYFNHHIVLGNITSIVGMTNYEALEAVIRKYSLHLPTAEEVCEAIRYSTDLYWRDERFFKEIEAYVNCLDSLQRAAFLYTGDLHHLKKHNPEFVRQFLMQLSTKVMGHHDAPEKAIKSAHEDHLILAFQICAKESEDTEKKLENFRSREDMCTVALTVEHVAQVVTDYADLIRALWVTPNLPASVAHFPNSIRRSALTSDTDSTIFTVQDWALWYKDGKISFDEETMSMVAAVVFLAASTITHVLAIMSANMGIVKERLHTIAMKNEFKFDVFIPTMLGKHYFADISCQEGNVYSEGRRKTETKGVNLKNSNAPRSIREQADSMRKRMMLDIRQKGQIEMLPYLKEVADVERSIIASVRRGESSYLRLGSIKDSETYTKDAEESPYQNHTFWNTVFGPKYGEVPQPPYRTLKISLTTDNTLKWRRWLETMQDQALANRLREWCKMKNKSYMSTIYLPEPAMDSHGVPEELTSIIFADKIVMDICKVFYIQLEALGYFGMGKKVKRLISEYH